MKLEHKIIEEIFLPQSVIMWGIALERMINKKRSNECKSQRGSIIIGKRAF